MDSEREKFPERLHLALYRIAALWRWKAPRPISSPAEANLSLVFQHARAAFQARHQLFPVYIAVKGHGMQIAVAIVVMNVNNDNVIVISLFIL